AVFVAAYFADVWHGSHQYWQVAAVPLAMLLAAAIAKRLVIRRPWLEALLSYLVIVMPLVAEICGRIASWSSRGQIEMVIAYGLLGIALIGWGIILRDHAIFISAAVCFGVAAFEAQDLVQIAIEWQLIAGGVVLLAIAGIVARLLRGREAGFVSTPQRLTRYARPPVRWPPARCCTSAPPKPRQASPEPRREPAPSEEPARPATTEDKDKPPV